MCFWAGGPLRLQCCSGPCVQNWCTVGRGQLEHLLRFWHPGKLCGRSRRLQNEGENGAKSMPKWKQKTCQKGGRERSLNKVGIATLSWSPSWAHFLPLWALGCPFWEPFGNPVAPGGTYNSSFWEQSRQKWLQMEILDSNGHGVADGIKSRAQRVWILRRWSLENRAPV